MTPAAEAALTRLETLLVEERDAIQRIDADAVVRAAAEKETLLVTLVEGRLGQHPHLARRFQSIVGELRRNGVLLAHGRDCLRDAIAAIQADAQGNESSVRTRVGARLNLVG